MMVIDGKRYSTVSDAAAELGVSTRTVNGYIIKGIIPPPPTISQGLRDINIFPDEYMKLAKDRLRAHRARRRNSNG